jgi:hypothetical protein
MEAAGSIIAASAGVRELDCDRTKVYIGFSEICPLRVMRFAFPGKWCM